MTAEVLPEYKQQVIATVVAVLWIAESVAPHFPAFLEDRGRRLIHGGRNLFIGLLNGLIGAFILSGLLLTVSRSD